MTPPRLLLVEDKGSLARMLTAALEEEGYAVTACADAESGLRALEDDTFDLALTDLKLPGKSGVDLVERAGEIAPRVPVVVLTAFGTVETAVKAMKLGAVDFLEKPVELDELFALVRSLVIPGEEEAEVFQADPESPPIVGSHPRLRSAIRLLERVAPTDATVLLTGESGTGKELFARNLHALSPRSPGPFVAVNCAALPEALMESELFGHQKGAFTGAHRRQRGRFERAEEGTLFLDEIGELSLAVQSKILRVLEERTYEPVGGGGIRKADVRLAAATNRPLEAMVEEGRFRSDLYFRLEVFPIHLPPLRDRPDDIPRLARHLLGHLAERHGVEPPVLSQVGEEALQEVPWPGNVRQLKNLLERAVILYPAARLGPEELQPLLSPLEDTGGRPGERAIRRALRETSGDKRAAAERLGISYRTLQRRVNELDLEGFPEYRG